MAPLKKTGQVLCYLGFLMPFLFLSTTCIFHDHDILFMMIIRLHVDRGLKLDKLAEAVSAACGVLLGGRRGIVLLGAEADGETLWDIVIARARDKRTEQRLSLVSCLSMGLRWCFSRFGTELIEHVASVILFHFSTLPALLNRCRLWYSHNLRVVLLEYFMPLY